MFVVFQAPTDGRRPARMSLIAPVDTQSLLFYPPTRTATAITYRAELSSQPFPGNQPATTSQSTDFSFASAGGPMRQVFFADAPTSIGEIYSVDITVGAYLDRFRLAFQKPDATKDATIFGISVISTDGTVVAGQRTDISVSGPLSLTVLSTDSPSMTLDLNGDGQADLEFFDRLSTPAEHDGGGPPVRNRDHDILATGPALPGGADFTYSVRDGLISAGSTTPRAQDQPAASNAQAVTGLQQQQTMGVTGLTRPEDMGTLRGELDAVETLLVTARLRAHEGNFIGDDVFNNWTIVEGGFGRILAQMADPSRPVDSQLQSDAATHALTFYASLATAINSSHVLG